VGSVCENSFEDIPRLRRTAVRSDRVADRTRADLALGRMTTEAVIVRCEGCRDMPSRTCEIVTRDTPLRGSRISPVVHRVVELHVKSLDKGRWECLDLVRIARDILVADRAHRLRIAARKLAQMTTDARLVTRIVHLERLALAMMAGSAVELHVLGNGMRKGFESLVVSTRRDSLWRLGGRDRGCRALLLFEAASGKEAECTHDEHETQSCLPPGRHSLFLQGEVARRDRIAPNCCRMTIRALHRLVLLPLGHLIGDRGLKVRGRTLLRTVEWIAMTGRTREDRDIRVSHCRRIGVLCDAHVTSHAVLPCVVLLCVVELYRITGEFARVLIWLR